MSPKLVKQISLGLEELAGIREQLLPLIAKTSDPTLGVLETAAASAMLHRFIRKSKKRSSSLPVNVTATCQRTRHGIEHFFIRWLLQENLDLQ